MALTTKLSLFNGKVFQDETGNLNLSGTTRFNNAFYIDEPTIDEYLEIPYAGWVTGLTSNIIGENGLDSSGTTTGRTIYLGGDLLRDTVINGVSTYNLTLTGLTSFNISATTTNITGDVKLLSTPDSGNITTDSVLVLNPNDNQIKSIGVEEIKRYNVTAVTATSITANTNDNLILVDTSLSAVTVNLPTTIDIGTSIRIKDKGNAYVNNITIDSGSGNVIDDDQCALINTNFGALELVYGETNTWYTLGFIN